MVFTTHTSDTAALAEAGDIWAVQRLRWFADDFVAADVIDGRLVITDLRMGQESRYVFRHVVAERGNPSWQPILPERMMVLFDRSDLASVLERITNP
jgi:inner membrane protein